MPSERLIRAIELARSGHKAAAREILEEIVRAEPTNEAAWLWLADTQPNDETRLQILREAQKHLPRSANITKALAIISARIEPSSSAGG
ncbi:tetratricopeptide repeat protein, partial [Thermanaerothrix sp.]